MEVCNILLKFESSSIFSLNLNDWHTPFHYNLRSQYCLFLLLILLFYVKHCMTCYIKDLRKKEKAATKLKQLKSKEKEVFE